MEYFECDVPSGDGLCSDNKCPCPQVAIPRGSGCLYIEQSLVDSRREYPSMKSAEGATRRKLEQVHAASHSSSVGVYRLSPILVCEQGAKLRNLDLDVAAADAKYWWKTGKVPLRATPLAGSKADSPALTDNAKLLTKLKVLVAVAMADGKVDKQEHALLQRFCTEIGLDPRELEELFAQRKVVKRSDLPESQEEKRRLLSDVIKIAAADGRVDDLERRMVAKIAASLGLTRDDVKASVQEAKRQKPAAARSSDNREGRSEHSGETGEQPARSKQRAFSHAEHLQTFTGASASLYCVALSSDAAFVIAGGQDHQLRLWRSNNSKVERTFLGHTNPITSVALSSDGRYALSCSGGGDALKEIPVRLWEIRSGKCVASLEGHNRAVNSVAISPDDQFALTACCDGTVLFREFPSGEVVMSIAAPGVECASFSPSGGLAITGSRSPDNGVRIWDLAGRCLATLLGHTSDVLCAALVPGNQFAVSGSRDHTLWIWDWTKMQSRPLKGHQERITSIAITPDGRYAFSGSTDRTIKLWRIDSGECVASLEQDGARISCISLSPDARFLAASSWDKVVHIWELFWTDESPKKGELVSAVPAVAVRSAEPWEAFRQFVSVPSDAPETEQRRNMRFQFMFNSASEADRILSSLPQPLAGKLPAPKTLVGTRDLGSQVVGKHIVSYEGVTLSIGDGKRLMNLIVEAGGEIFEAFLD